MVRVVKFNIIIKIPLRYVHPHTATIFVMGSTIVVVCGVRYVKRNVAPT